MKKIIIALMTIALSIPFMFTDIKAEETTENYILEADGEKTRTLYLTEELDEFIEIMDNKYYLVLPDNIDLTEEMREYSNKNLNNSNKVIETEDKTISVMNKSYDSVEANSLGRAYGVNKIEFYWNFSRLFLSAGFINAFVGVTLTMILIYFGWPSASFGGAVLGGILYLQQTLGWNLKHGYSFDIDYFLTVFHFTLGIWMVGITKVMRQ